jgi:hypothetical protein
MIKRGAIIIGMLLAGVASGTAETPEQRQACTDAAFQFCSDAIPDRDRVFACLAQNRSVLPPLCREAMNEFLPPDPPPMRRVSGPPAKSKTKKAGSKTAAEPLNLNPKVR